MDNSSPVTYEMHAVMKGTVQGVGFRATTRYYASQLGLRGTVRNLDSGHVEIYAQGPKKHLEQLIHYLKEEAGFRRVEAEMNYSSVHIPFKDFQIIH